MRDRGKFSDPDAYLAGAAEALCPLLEMVRARLRAALPDAQEILKYDMPGFVIGGTVIAGYAAFSRQAGLYVTSRAIASHAQAIAQAGLKSTKTGVTFSPQKPIPGDLVTSLAQASRRELGF